MHGEKGTGKGLKNVRVSQKNKGAQNAQNTKGRGEFRTREESEPKSRGEGARTREFGNLGRVGTKSCRSKKNKGKREREPIYLSTVLSSLFQFSRFCVANILKCGQ